MQNENPILIREGVIYQLRNGLETAPVQKSNNNTNFKFSAEVQEPEFSTPTIMCWTLTGKYLYEGVDCRFDIVKVL